MKGKIALKIIGMLEDMKLEVGTKHVGLLNYVIEHIKFEIDNNRRKSRSNVISRNMNKMKKNGIS